MGYVVCRNNGAAGQRLLQLRKGVVGVIGKLYPAAAGVFTPGTAALAQLGNKILLFFLAGALAHGLQGAPHLAQCVGQLCHAVARHRACGPALGRARRRLRMARQGRCERAGRPRKQARGGRQHPGGGHQRVKGARKAKLGHQGKAVLRKRGAHSAQKASAAEGQRAGAARLAPQQPCGQCAGGKAHRGRCIGPVGRAQGHRTGCGIQRRPLRPVAFGLGQAHKAGRHMRR